MYDIELPAEGEYNTEVRGTRTGQMTSHAVNTPIPHLLL